MSKAILLNCSVDLPARAMLSSIGMGCLYCEDAGTTVGSDHLHPYWPYKAAAQRTRTSLLHNAEMAVATGSPVRARKCSS